MLQNARRQLPPLRRSRVSKLKEEKVVSPPRKPTASSRRRGSAMSPYFSVRSKIAPMTSPIKKLPTALTASVPRGNAAPQRAAAVVTKNRTAAPSPPPTKTRKKLLIVIVPPFFYGAKPNETCVPHANASFRKQSCTCTL